MMFRDCRPVLKHASSWRAWCRQLTDNRGVQNKFWNDNVRYLNLIKMLYLIGLGLSDETDITVKGLETVKKCSRVYLEAYTSILLVDKSILVRPLYNTRFSC